MRLIIILSFLTTVLFISCKNCKDTDCIGNMPFYFKIIDENGKSLDSAIVLDSIPVEFYYFQGTSRLNLNLWKSLTYDGSDTVYVSEYSISEDRYFLKYQEDPADTLDLAFESFPTDCCGDTYSISSVSLNNQPVENKDGIYLLKIRQ